MSNSRIEKRIDCMEPQSDHERFTRLLIQQELSLALNAGKITGEEFRREFASRMGDDKGKELDPIAAGANGSQLIIFQDGGGVAIRGLYGVAAAIGKIDRKTDKDIHVAVVYVSDDADRITRFAESFPKFLEMGVDSISLSKDGREGPGAYGLNRTASQTIIMAKGGKVTRNFVFPQGMLYADPHMMGGVAELIDEDREVVAEWLAGAGEEKARMEMRRRDDPQAAAKAAFREKLGEFVKAEKISREEARELCKAAFHSDRDR